MKDDLPVRTRAKRMSNLSSHIRRKVVILLSVFWREVGATNAFTSACCRGLVFVKDLTPGGVLSAGRKSCWSKLFSAFRSEGNLRYLELTWGHLWRYSFYSSRCQSEWSEIVSGWMGVQGSLSRWSSAFREKPEHLLRLMFCIRFCQEVDHV